MGNLRDTELMPKFALETLKTNQTYKYSKAYCTLLLQIKNKEVK